MRNSSSKVYRNFEEFEREELNRMETVSASVDDMLDTIFGEELDFESRSGRRSSWNNDDED